MYLTAIAWIYVVLMMSIAEATSSTGTVLGALMTFLLYGALPLALVMYVMNTPARRRQLKAKALAEESLAEPAQPLEQSNLPNTSGHAAGAVAEGSVTAVRKEA
jgi:prolyl-tRNA editing enzyme YbaK/EbsC (Cys-tRNA(Pro) deacylase)